MINVLIPACGNSQFFEDNYYPQNVTEIDGKPMIEHVISNYKCISDVKFTVCLFAEECDKFHTDKIVQILTEGKCNIVKQEGMTAGALCTSLLAIDFIGTEDELIIANSDTIIDEDISVVIEHFRKNSFEAGVISFNSVHPRWSYIRLNSENEVVETAEKQPLSKHAIAGFYYFAHGKDFIEAAKQVIRKRETYDGRFYISSSLNEIILKNKRVGYYEIPSKKYHSLYSPEKIVEYQKEVKN